MAKIDAAPTIALEDLPGVPEEMEPFFVRQNQVNQSVVNALRGALSFGDNTTSGYFIDTFAHGVEKIIRNPLKVSPVGAHAIRAEKLSTDAPNAPAHRVRSVGLRYINGSDPRAPEQLGITVFFEPPSGRLRLALLANQTGIPAGTGTAVGWTTQRENTCAQLSHSTSTNNSRVVCLRPGVIRIEHQIAWVSRTAAAGDYIGSWVLKNGAASGADTRHGYSRVGQATSASGTSATCTFDVAAGDYLEVLVQQNNTAASTMDIQGNQNNEAYASFEYADVSTTERSRVTLFLHGG